jgi:hypothetical protein
MMDNTRGGLPDPKPPGETGATLLAVGGFATAFGAASCFALPVLLGSLGLDSAWLSSLALLAGPYRSMLLAAAVVCLVGGGGTLLWRRRAAIGCASGAACSRSVVTGVIMGVLSLGVVLTLLGFVFAWALPVIPYSTITCPTCGSAKTETMPTDACQFFYECTGCGMLLRPKPGDCCVFCSYGSVPCPPIQQAGEAWAKIVKFGLSGMPEPFKPAFEEENEAMAQGQRKKIEIFTAGCLTCNETVELVIAGSSHDIEIHDMHQPHIAAQAKQHGIRSLPSVVVDGKLADCCAGRGPDEVILRQAIGWSRRESGFALPAGSMYRSVSRIPRFLFALKRPALARIWGASSASEYPMLQEASWGDHVLDLVSIHRRLLGG